ncbi:MAG TPA: DUF4846 domain-containing protein, partial [Niabella sp.]|nr:DUF4846 domain-containing protein [Niabella sp.]
VYDEPAKPASNADVFRDVGAIRVPAGFTRLPCKEGSFGYWLRKVRLKLDKQVFLYNGRLKPNQQAQFAVMDISVGAKDLQQCADAIMRLRAEYLFEQKRFTDIVFSDNLGKKYGWTGGSDKTNFQRYLDRVFGMCGTASLEKQLNPGSLKNVEPGDVFIKGGFPGHAMIVVDVVVNEKGERRFMLAQSYMPAQDIHVVRNPDADSSPWYKADDLQPITTPEWTFSTNQLRKW